MGYCEVIHIVPYCVTAMTTRTNFYRMTVPKNNTRKSLAQSRRIPARNSVSALTVPLNAHKQLEQFCAHIGANANWQNALVQDGRCMRLKMDHRFLHHFETISANIQEQSHAPNQTIPT